MNPTDVLRTALGQLRANPLRAVFTLLGIIVSVAFLVAVVAVIQGLNAYVRENVAGAVVGTNAFQVRRTPLVLSPFDDEAVRRLARRPSISEADAEAVRLSRRLRPGQDNDFSIETSEALVSFWKQITALLFSVIPAVVSIGVVVGGIVIMNVMLMAVNERMREIGIRKAVGARARDIERQFLVEAIVLSTTGGILGALLGWGFAALLAATTPLPARVTGWSIALAITIGLVVGIAFGVYPARRAAKLDPISALHKD